MKLSKKTIKDKILKSRVFKLSLFLTAGLTTAIFLIIILNLLFLKRTFPHTSVNDLDIGSLTFSEANSLLAQKVIVPAEILIEIPPEKSVSLNLKEINFNYRFSDTVNQAFQIKKELGPCGFLKTVRQPIKLTPQFTYDEEKLTAFLDETAQTVTKKGSLPTAEIENGRIKITNGTAGVLFNQELVAKELTAKFANFDFSPLVLDTVSDEYVLSGEEMKNYEERVKKLIGKTLVITLDDYLQEIPDKELVKLTDYFQTADQKKLQETVKKIAQEVERKPQNPIFNFENGVVKEFQPAQDGLVLNQEELIQTITESLKKLEESPEKKITLILPVRKIPPEYQTEDVNSLGIKELVGKGNSKFAGSISSRIHNIQLAASKFNGFLLKPDEVFSFNQVLGEVSSATGYQQAYIIKEGQTVLGDGGGVCQVSTTLFRTVLNAGLPVLERQAHAYRVGYYEQDSPPGFDATVFSPSPDLKFKNDTGNHLLIQSKVNTAAKTITFEIYGTKDGREVSISKPTITNLTPPPPDLYIDDPSLPAGQIKQIDWKAWGARVWFDYRVSKNGQEIFQKRFYSNYQPWQAKFLKGIAASP